MTAVAERPRPATAFAPDAENASTAALTFLTIAGAVCMRRLFADWSYLGPVVLAGVAAHLAAWLCRVRGARAPTVIGAPIAIAVVIISWVQLPETTWYGIPTATTLHTALTQLGDSFDSFKTVVAPAPVSPGFVLATILAVVVGASLADWAAYRMGAMLEATIPSFSLFVFTAALGSARYRPLSVAIELTALLLFLLVHQTGLSGRASAWFASRSPGGWLPLARPGLGLGLVAVIAALAVGPHMPGSSSAALLSWRNKDNNGPSSRSTVSPFVTIRGRLVNQSGVEVFSVQTNQKAYWRLTSLDTFDGDIWSSNDSYRAVNGRRLPRGVSAPQATNVIQRFTIDTLDSIWLPAAYEPTRVDGINDVSFNGDSGSLISANDTTNGLTYTITSALPSLDGPELAALSAPDPNSVRRYLSLPNIPKKVTELAQRIVAGKTTEYDKALALQNYLRSAPFRYNLKAAAGHSGNALERFLLVTHEGYCEQFAGSYAVMARAVGLPTRVAVGFTPGTFNPSDGTYHVRDEHAHAWPEVFFSNIGWVAFEPTPGRGEPGAQSYTGVPEAQLGEDGTTPTPAVTTPVTPPTTIPPLGRTGSTLPRDVTLEGGKATTNHHRSPLTTAVWVLLVIVAIAALWAVAIPLASSVLRRRRRARAEAPADLVLVAWREANGALAMAGAGRKPHETLTEHARRAGPAVHFDEEARRALVDLAGDAGMASYAGGPIAPEAGARAVQAAETVEGALSALATRGQRIKRALDPRSLTRSGR
ncbi:MAG: hypothetical protein QOG64_2713 [Acidimicrobiaceae bacterium]|nr:hypothetical protein [Acidimicrobiaceae bacterium]